MATPTEPLSPPAGEPESPAPGTEPVAPVEGAPDPHGSPGEGLPQALADGTMVSGRAVHSPDGPPAPPVTPAQPTDTPSPSAEPDASAPGKKGDRPEISELPQWAQDLIKDTRGEVARSRVEAKKQAAEEAAVAAKKQMAEDIGRALGLITDDTPEEEQLTPEQLSDLLAGERQSTRAARTELAVFKAANNPESELRFNAAALLDSRAFIDSVKDIDPSDAEAVGAAIAAAVNANPWLRLDVADTAEADLEPEVDQPVRRRAPQPPAPPSGGSFAGGPGGQRQDLASMSIDDFRKLRRNTPRP